MDFTTFYTEYTTLMGQAGVVDSPHQASMFADALNQQDLYLLSTDHNYRQEEHKGITIKRINELMQILIPIRE